MKRINEVQLRDALVRAYGFTKKNINITRDPRRPGSVVVTAHFKDSSAPLVLKGRSLIKAAITNPRLAEEFS